MKPYHFILFAIVVAALNYFQPEPARSNQTSANIPPVPIGTTATRYTQNDAGKQRQGTGVVTRVLTDDNEGSRHQRFIIRVASGQTLLITHNIDLAPRIANIDLNDTVEFNGEYEWNNQGGVVHWTHRDPAGKHIGGWLKHKGRTYQ